MATGGVIEVVKEDRLTVVMEKTGLCEGGAFKIVTEIIHGMVYVFRGFSKMDDPVFVVMHIQPGIEIG